jgi:hypothetical protein
MTADQEKALRHVATLIAKGDPPQWLVDGLKHFAINPAPAPKEAVEVIERMRKATDVLLRYVPLFEHLDWGLRVLDVPKTMAVLSQLKHWLDRAKAKPKTGRPASFEREICAQVVLEAWKQCRGKTEPHSQQLREACEEYWKAWKGKPVGKAGDVENWRRTIERADAKKVTIFEKVFVALRANVVVMKVT